MADNNKTNEAAKLDAEGQKVMADAMSSVPYGEDLSDTDAKSLYQAIYGSANKEPDLTVPEAPKSPDDLPPHQTRHYFMNGMSSDVIPQPDAGQQQENVFNKDEQDLLRNLGQPQPPETGTTEVENLRTQVARLQQVLQTQQQQLKQTNQQSQQVAQQPPAQDNSQEAVDRDLNTLDSILQSRFGMKLNDVYQQLAYSNQVVDYVGALRAQQKVETMKDELKSKWGSDYDYRFGEARRVYETLPDADKSKIDQLGSRGAELLWAKAAEEGAGQNVPNFDRGKPSRRNTPPSQDETITKEELLAMSQEEYERQMRPGGRLWNATTQGRVDFNM